MRFSTAMTRGGVRASQDGCGFLIYYYSIKSKEARFFSGYHADQALNNLSILQNVPCCDELNILEFRGLKERKLVFNTR